MRVKLNNSGSSEADDLNVTVLRNGEVIVERPVDIENSVYPLLQIEHMAESLIRTPFLDVSR